MTFSIGDRVRLIESYTNDLPAGATAVVTRADGMFTSIRWEPPRDTPIASLYTHRFERVDDDQPSTEAAPPSTEIDGVEYRVGDVLELREDQTGVGRALSRFGRVRLSRILHGRQGGDAMGFFEPFEGITVPDGGWLISRFRHTLPRVGDRVRGVWQDDHDHLGTVISVTPSLTDPAEGSAQVTWDSDGDTGSHLFSRLRVVGRGSTDAEQGEGNSDAATVEEWQKKWTDLVLAAHRIADDHNMCSSFEHNTVDLGIPPRHRHRHEVDFDDEGFETPDLVIDETENEYCVHTTRTVQITVPVTVSVTQGGHGHYTGSEEPDERLLDWGTVEWEEIEPERVAQALYDSTLSDLRYAVHLDGDEEVTPNEGDEEIIDWELSE